MIGKGKRRARSSGGSVGLLGFVPESAPSRRTAIWAFVKKPIVLVSSLSVTIIGAVALPLATNVGQHIDENVLPSTSPRPPSHAPATSIPARKGGNPVGTALQTTVNSANSQGETANIAFAAGPASKIPIFAKRYQAYIGSSVSGGTAADTLDAILGDALQVGAYSYRSTVLQLQLNTDTGQTVTVYDIRPVVVQRFPIATAGVINYALGAGPTDRIDFDLDDPNVPGREDVGGKITQVPYFPNQTVEVRPGRPENLQLKFTAEAASDTFYVLIDYDMDGKKFTQMVTAGKSRSPLYLRVTGSPCDTPHGMKPQDLRRFKALNYQTVLGASTNSDGSVVVQPVDPKQFIINGCSS